MSKIHEGKTDIGFERPDSIVEEKVCRKSGLLPVSGCYQDYRGSAVITELFARGTVPTEHCEYHTSWGAMLVPEDLRDLDTDDRYFRYQPEETEEADGDGEENLSNGRVIISEQGPGIKKSPSN